MEPVPLTLEEEIALEGLDGITTESLWYRMSVRLKLPLPFYDHFKSSLWNIVLKREGFEFFQIAQPRQTVKHLDRLEYYSNNDIPDDVIEEKIKQGYYIYSYDPVDDPQIRGSCKEFKKRLKLDREGLKKLTFAEIEQKYGQTLVIVASQKLRNRVLIPLNIGRECDINNHAYCILERIGRSRYFGETTSGKFSLNDFVKDSKLLHYFRNSLLKNNLVIRQNINQKIRGRVICTQLFHIPRFYIMVRTTNMVQVEKLLTYLKSKPNYAATCEEARNAINLASKTFLAFLRSRSNLFEYKKYPYREIYPKASKEEYALKNNQEKKIMGIKLIEPDFDISRLYVDDEKEEVIEEDEGFLDCSNQILKRSLIHQVVMKIEESGTEGMSQTEIGKYFGLSKLNARAVLRNAQRTQGITYYMKDKGRQRVSTYISKNFLEQRNKELVDQVAKLLSKADDSNVAPIQIVSYDQAQTEVCNDEEMNESSETRISIPLTLLKEEIAMTPNVIQYIPPADVHHQFESNKSACTNESTDFSNIVFIPDDEFSFVDNIENVQVTLQFLSSIPEMKKECKGLQEAIAQNKVSQKILTRMNLILDAIKEKTVIDGVTLLQILRQKEIDFVEVICRKSMLTLCGRLAVDNLIKVIEMRLKSATKDIKVLFFGEPNVTFDLRCWSSIIEELKIQHFIPMNRPMNEDIAKDEASVAPVISTISFESKTSISQDEFSAQSTRHENFPKFMKYRLFHEFLYYLIYDYSENYVKIPVERAVEVWKQENQRIQDYDEISERITTCYSTEISWKTFIPPLNAQKGYESGWGLLRDIIHRMPLILYIKFTRYGQQTKNLNDYLLHPIKCNYLLHFLPSEMRKSLYQGRKYAGVMMQLCRRLCWMGLLQFGPTRTKQIDETYIYLNRNTMLLDTRSSDVGYLEVSDKEYPKLEYHFDSMQNVTDYWTRMFEISINTPINKKSTALGQTVVIEELHTKPDLIAALAVQTSTSAPQNDIGEIPGDRKGAAGLDKAFMSHLKQSWSRSIDQKRRAPSALSIETKKPRARPKKKERAATGDETVKTETKRRKVVKQKTQRPKSTAASSVVGLNNKSKIIRKITPKKQTVKELRKKSELYDDVDKEALKLMKTLRVSWSEVEDKTLLLAKVAMKFAFPNEAQCAHYINTTVIRDILHWRTEKSLNKTSKACQRRIMYLMKNKSQFKEQTVLYLEELRTNREFVMKYSNFADRLKKLYTQEHIYMVVRIHITEMIHRMHQILLKQYLTNDLDESRIEKRIFIKLPKDHDELFAKYEIVNPNDSLLDYKYHEPKSIKEVEVSILSSLIHGVECATKDKKSNAHYLVETYRKYSDENLSAAVIQLRRLTIISLNKNQKNKEKPVLPYTMSPFHLSNRYASQLTSVHVPVELYDEYLKSMKSLSSGDGTHHMRVVNCGWIFMLAELLNLKKVSLTFEKADKLITVDPSLKKKTNFDKISENYMMMKKQNEHEKSTEKVMKIVRFPPDNNSDEKFIYNDDPIEIFYKLDPRYLHIFCLLQAIESGLRVKVEKWSIQEEEVCTLNNCIIHAGDNFSIEMQKIASHGYDILKYLLNSSDEGPSKYDENLITKFNLIKIFDGVIEKYVEENEQTLRKMTGKLQKNGMKQTISTKFLLGSIYRIATESDHDDGTWLTEYKKISFKNDEEIFGDEDDDGDVEQFKHSRMLHQLKDLNVPNRSTDSFVVNLSTIYIDVNGESIGQTMIDGDSYDNRLLPFNEDEKHQLFERIKLKHVWMPDEMKSASLDKVFEEIMPSLLIKTKLTEIFNFLKSKAEMGANASDILQEFGDYDTEQMQKHIQILINHKLVLLTGVNEIRFIHKDYVTFWLIDNFYELQDENEEEPPVKKIKSIDDGQLTETSTDHGEVAMEIESSEAREPLTSKESKTTIETNDDEHPMDIEINNEQNTQTKTNPELSQEPKKNKVRYPYFLLACPWTRVGELNRTINRRALDKWMATLLNYLSINPGVLLSDLCSKFNILTPIHVRNLCEIMETLGCIKLMAFAELEINISSNYDDHYIEEPKSATFFDSFERTYIEVLPDALQRLTFFIGKRKYKIPFI